MSRPLGRSGFGFVPRHPDTLAFAHEARVLLLRHQPTGIDFDVALGCLPFAEEAVARATVVLVPGVAVPLATPEDLVIMKAAGKALGIVGDIVGSAARIHDIPDAPLEISPYWCAR